MLGDVDSSDSNTQVVAYMKRLMPGTATGHKYILVLPGFQKGPDQVTEMLCTSMGVSD
jgi:hypothetical protein